MTEMNRREFVAAAASVCAACLVCPSGLALAAEPPGPVDVGELKTFAKDGVVDTYARTRAFYVIRQKNRLYASTSICTHKNRRMGTLGENKTQIKCPEHGSIFSLDGLVVKGPAKNPLSRFAIKVDDKQHVVVDTSKRFEQKDWDNAAAFVTV